MAERFEGDKQQFGGSKQENPSQAGRTEGQQGGGIDREKGFGGTRSGGMTEKSFGSKPGGIGGTSGQTGGASGQGGGRSEFGGGRSNLGNRGEQGQGGINRGGNGGLAVLEKSKLSNHVYDILTVLHEKLKGLDVYEDYIRDCQREDPECAKVLEQIAEDDKKHVQMLKERIEQMVKDGSFR